MPVLRDEGVVGGDRRPTSHTREKGDSDHSESPSVSRGFKCSRRGVDQQSQYCEMSSIVNE